MKKVDWSKFLIKHSSKEEELSFNFTIVVVSAIILFLILTGLYIHRSFVERERMGYIKACEDFYYGKLKMEPIKNGDKIRWVEIKD